MRTFIKFFIALAFVSLIQGSNNTISSDSRDTLYRQEHGQQCSNVSDPQSFPELQCLPWPYRVGPPGDRFLRLGYCTTYDDSSGIQSFATCSYMFSDAFEVQKQRDGDGGMWYIELPKNICALNDFMCGPLNRTGRLCSECKDGYGLAVTSIGFQIPCSKCTNFWYPIALYIFMELVPITIFYLVILVFQINITTAPMTCYIMISQSPSLWWRFSFIGEDMHVSRRMFMLNDHLDLYMKVNL